ncbi:MAG: cytochrome c nitrite reductase small subunit [Chloroflexi bacterium]|nr:cytochrome c nitrite reductase small subunit [Chloroflexota bacterium]
MPVPARPNFFSNGFAAIPFSALLLLVALFGGIVGLGGFTFSYAEGGSYFSDNPEACANCHVMREVYDGWLTGPHKTVAVCNDCHTPHNSLVAKYAVKGLNGFNHSKAFTLNDYPEVIRITPFNREVAQANCIHCHEELVTLVSHPDDRNPTDCLKCHIGVGHGR